MFSQRIQPGDDAAVKSRYEVPVCVMGRKQQHELSRFVGLWLRVRRRQFQHHGRVGERPGRVLQRRQGHGRGRVSSDNHRCKRVERLHGAIVSW